MNYYDQNMLGLNYYNQRLAGLRELGTNNLSSSLLNPFGDYHSLLSGTNIANGVGGLDSLTNPYGNILDPMRKEG